MKNSYLLKHCLWVMAACMAACGTQKKLNSGARHLLQQPGLAAAHTGISLMDVETGKYLYNYQGDKYFIPASNTKLLTCYAAMKYLGDSLAGLDVIETADSIQLVATGDPTLLHPDFVHHPVYDFLKRAAKPLIADSTPWTENAYGTGWAWDDFSDDYMAERSSLPIYGNVVTVSGTGKTVVAVPRMFDVQPVASLGVSYGFVNKVSRAFHRNSFRYMATGKTNAFHALPFITSDSLGMQLLADTLHKRIALRGNIAVADDSAAVKRYTVYSQRTDSMLRRMMHRSDNFYAEQSLLMVGRTRLQQLRTRAIIDTLLATDYNEMPQRPRWVDGSGLSRYNLLSPQDFVWLLAKMKADFSWQRITGILQTGGEGTLSNYYKQFAGRIYAKTGTLSNNVALSGYLITDKGRTLAFSVIVNNHQASVTAIRREVEAFLGGVIKAY